VVGDAVEVGDAVLLQRRLRQHHVGAEEDAVDQVADLPRRVAGEIDDLQRHPLDLQRPRPDGLVDRAGVAEQERGPQAVIGSAPPKSIAGCSAGSGSTASSRRGA
jgi:hypothetical protein